MRVTTILISLFFLTACQYPQPDIRTAQATAQTPPTAVSTAVPPGERGAERAKMVRSQIVARGVKDPRVLDAMRTVPRHEFVPEELQRRAYDDRPLPIGYSQTISQPYIVAAMTELLSVEPSDKVLEIGTGSGYQAAVLAELGAHVYTIEIVCPLADQAREVLDRLGYGDRITSKCGDGYVGWEDHAPFDAVIVTAAPKKLPQALVDQLAPGGRLVVPEGDFVQDLVLVEKSKDGRTTRKELFQVMFVPMVREGREAPEDRDQRSLK